MKIALLAVVVGCLCSIGNAQMIFFDGQAAPAAGQWRETIKDVKVAASMPGKAAAVQAEGQVSLDTSYDVARGIIRGEVGASGTLATVAGKSVETAGPAGRCSGGQASTQEEVDVIIKTITAQTLHTNALISANGFFIDGLSCFKKAPDVSPYQRGATASEVLYWGMPRDLDGGQDSGQAFSEAVSLKPGDDDPSPFTLKVKGAAARDYTLSFTISKHTMSVKVPRGTTAAGAAELIAQKIDQDARQITESSRSTIMKNSGDFDSLTDIKAAAKDGAVTIILGIEG